METVMHNGVAIMYHPVRGKWYYYPEYTKAARYYKTLAAAQAAINKAG